MNLINIQRAIDHIETFEDLNMVIYFLEERQKQLASMQVAINKKLLTVGTKVKVAGPRGTEFGKVINIKRTKAIVDIEGQHYNCPMSILEAV